MHPKQILWMLVLLLMIAACRAAPEATTPSPVPASSPESTLPDLQTTDPSKPVTRGEMAVIVLQAIHGESYLPPAAAGGLFIDVSAHWAEAWIEQLVAEGMSGGYSDGSYRPDQAITRAEAAVVLLKASQGIDYAPSAPEGGVFLDTGGHWAEAWIEQLQVLGISSGFADDTFRPDAPLRASELAQMLRHVFP